MKTSILDALRLVLPLAENEADTLRELARDDADTAPEAEAATSAVTAARLALQDATAVRCHVAYRVTFARVCTTGAGWSIGPHQVRVLAADAEDAQDRAIAACEAAALIHGDVLRVERLY